MITACYTVERPMHSGLFKMAMGCIVAAYGLMGTGCILPISLEVETTDAGFSSPPIIDSAAAPFEFPGPLQLVRDDVGAEISLTVLDNDLDDSLFVRLFVDYDPESGSGLATDCTAPPSGTRSRVVVCPTANICPQIDLGDTDSHALEAVVTDREFLLGDDPDAVTQPPFRAFALDSGHAIRGWSITCN